jgi:hypothetical protein
MDEEKPTVQTLVHVVEVSATFCPYRPAGHDVQPGEPAVVAYVPG